MAVKREQRARAILVPRPARIEAIEEETPDVKTFHVAFADSPPSLPFEYGPGQCAMVSVLGTGECMISLSNSPTRVETLDFSIKRMGRVTGVLHEMEVGSPLGIRGPYGNGFPVDEWKGRDLVFIGGGIGLAPLRSIINFVMDRRADYGDVTIIYGARSPADLVFKPELLEIWPQAERTEVHLTVDSSAGQEWNGPVGFVPPFVEELQPAPRGSVAVTCGPPIMIKFVLAALRKLGFQDEQVYTTLEMKMQCGVGKCGRCNIGSKYVCVDGPVFSVAELGLLPQEF